MSSPAREAALRAQMKARKEQQARAVSEGDLETPGAHILVEIEGLLFDVPVGDGGQTMRWLGTVAQQRLQSAKAKGWAIGSRHGAFLGKARPVGVMLGDKTIKPTVKLRELYTRMGRDPATGDLLDPDAPEPATLVVVLREHMPTKWDIDGAPKQTMWEAEAFNHSESGQRKLAKRVAEARLEEERVAAEAARIKAAEEAEEAKRLERMLMGDLDNKELVDALLEREWKHIRLAWATDDEKEIKAIKDLMSHHFINLSDLFKYAAGAGSTGRNDEMSVNEWQQCVMNMPGPVCNFGTEHSFIKSVFDAATAGREMGDDNTSLTRFEFLEALLRLAVWKYGKAKGAGTGASRGKLSPHGALQKLFEAHVLPAMKILNIGVVRTLMRSNTVKAMFARVIKRLLRIFERYSKAELDMAVVRGGAGGAGGDASASGARAGGAVKMSAVSALTAANSMSINLQEFTLLVKESGLSRPDPEDPSKKSILTMADIRRVFAGAQGEDLDGPSPSPAAPVPKPKPKPKAAGGAGGGAPAKSKGKGGKAKGGAGGPGAGAGAGAALAPLDEVDPLADALVDDGDGSIQVVDDDDDDGSDEGAGSEGGKKEDVWGTMQDLMDNQEDSSDELVLNEFLEALARLAIAKYKHAETMRDEEKVARVLMQITGQDKGLFKAAASASMGGSFLTKAVVPTPGKKKGSGKKRKKKRPAAAPET